MEVKPIIEISVSGLLKASIGSTRACEVNDAVDITGDGCQGLVRGEVKLTRTDRSLLVTGRLSTDAEVVCSRCLTPFRLPLTFDIEEEYFPIIDIISGNPLANPGEPGSFAIDEHHILDLSEAIRQYVLMAIPIKTLCQADCAGLCPTCGQNLNQGSCDCSRRGIDPRWAKLKEIAHVHNIKGR